MADETTVVEAPVKEETLEEILLTLDDSQNAKAIKALAKLITKK